MKNLNKILGITGLLIFVWVFTWIFSDLLTEHRWSFLTAYNQENLLKRIALFGIISIGVAFVIITGGIDLSVGSVICLVGVGFPWLLMEKGWPLGVALPVVLLVAAGIGLIHGLLITKLKLQPFVVTLCGLLIYRGISRGFTGDQTQGFQNSYKGLKTLATGKIQLTADFGIPMPLVFLVIVGVASAFFLNRTVYGRHLKALGNNEEAAKFSGINTDRMIISAYVICSSLAGLGGLLFVLDVNSAQPVDFGNFYELYAIAAAVLGGCSLRGGEGTIMGVIIGTAVMRVLNNSINLIDWISKNIEFAVIGAVILTGVIVDELAKRMMARRRSESNKKQGNKSTSVP